MYGYPELYKISNTRAFLQLTKRLRRRRNLNHFKHKNLNIQKQCTALLNWLALNQSLTMKYDFLSHIIILRTQYV